MLIRGLVKPNREGILAMYRAITGKEATHEDIVAMEKKLAEAAKRGILINAQSHPDTAGASTDASPRAVVPDGDAPDKS